VRYFNTAGPCDPEIHYMLPPEPRLPEARPLIERGSYFVLHAPRQTGKTTAIRSLARALTAEGKYAALMFSCERAQPAGEDFSTAQRLILQAIAQEADRDLPPELRPPTWPDAQAGGELSAGLKMWAEQCPRPLVLFFDEIDALRDESLASVLHQLRDGFRNRRDSFPHSVMLCGLRDIRDYKVASGGDGDRLGTASPFNIKIASLRLGDFTRADVEALYAQHTDATGQAFTPKALDQVWDATAGQPWLVNALAHEIVDPLAMNLPSDVEVTAEHVAVARERLIRARATHLDSLASKLQEPRVRRVVEPLIAGEIPAADPTYDDDLSYVRDLGLIAQDSPVRVANAMYREVIVRILATRTESVVTTDPRTFVRDDGTLDIELLLSEFTEFWRENGEVLTEGASYKEVAAQLVMMGYLHRAINGHGFIDREYGVGRRRIDLLIRWPWNDADGTRRVQKQVLELKVWRSRSGDPLQQGLVQIDGYLDRTAQDTGILVIFDQRKNSPEIHDRITRTTETTPTGKKVTLLRL
jgi:hypothetical protein